MRGRVRALTRTAAVTTVAGMIATPLMPQGSTARRVLSTVVVTGHFATTLGRSSAVWGLRRAAGAAAGIAVATATVERIGTRTGLPFGRYHYTSALRPQLAGVPAIVPLAWFAMAVPARETAHAALGHRSSLAGRIVLGSAALTAWDLFLDPQMVGEGYWRWDRHGRYRGIPLTNYLGWFLTGLGVIAAIEAVLPADRVADPGLVGEYSVMAVMETVGFGVFFRDRVVALAGGAAMLPITVVAMRRMWDRRHWRIFSP
jgi:uncharacterized membrane protein